MGFPGGDEGWIRDLCHPSTMATNSHFPASYAHSLPIVVGIQEWNWFWPFTLGLLVTQKHPEVIPHDQRYGTADCA
jgi:hypothetical protein